MVLPFCEGGPCFHLNVVILKELLCADLLLERIDFDLIYRGRDLVMNDQVHDSVRQKVRDPNGPRFALLVQFFHRAPFAVDIAERFDGSNTGRYSPVAVVSANYQRL